MIQVAPSVVPAVLTQHVRAAIYLADARPALLRRSRGKLRNITRADERLSAHLDALRIAGHHALPFCQAALESPSAGAVFTATISAVDDGRPEGLQQLLALVETCTEARAGLFAAFGWLEPEDLRGVIVDMLQSSEPLKRLAGIAACSMHRVDPGLSSARRFADSDPLVRARAWRTAGELGRQELVSTAAAAAATVEENPAVQFWSAWSAVLLGDRHGAFEQLTHFAGFPGPFRARAFQLAIQAMSVEGSHALLQPLAEDPASIRRLIRGAGLAGDPMYVPWLISLMANDQLSRPAGESFSLITGLDLAWLDLERKPPKNFTSGPNDDPNDPNVDMDKDDGLPWPDQKLIHAWWSVNSHRFQAGVRHFMGEPLNRENCLRVLKEGYQRQRIAAALYLALLTPGAPLFEWRAPAWRQQQLLAAMH